MKKNYFARVTFSMEKPFFPAVGKNLPTLKGTSLPSDSYSGTEKKQRAVLNELSCSCSDLT